MYGTSLPISLSSATLDNGADSPLPLTLSLFAALPLYEVDFSPVPFLKFPVIRLNFPYSYFVIIFLDLLNSFFVKWAAIQSSRYSSLLGQVNQAVVDMSSLRQIYSSLQPASASSPVPMVETFGENFGKPPGPEGTPAFPRGMDFGLSLSAPFCRLPGAKTDTLYNYRFLTIKNVPGYVLPLLSLFAYFFLYPYVQQRKKEFSQNDNSPH